MVPPSSPLKGVSMCPGRPPAQSPDKPPPVLPLVLLDAGSCSDTYSSRQPPPPQPRNLLGRGHAKSLLKRGKGITPRFRLQRGVHSEAVGPLPQGPCTQPRSPPHPPVHRGPAGRDGHRLPLPGHPGLQHHHCCGGQFTCPLPPLPRRAPPCTLVLGRLWLECPGMQAQEGQC